MDYKSTNPAGMDARVGPVPPMPFMEECTKELDTLIRRFGEQRDRLGVLNERMFGPEPCDPCKAAAEANCASAGVAMRLGALHDICRMLEVQVDRTVKIA